MVRRRRKILKMECRTYCTLYTYKFEYKRKNGQGLEQRAAAPATAVAG